MNSLEPFYPCQTVSGETYVVDGRRNKVVSVVSCSFDMAERWHIAKLRARALNDAHMDRTFARRQRRVVMVLVLTLVLIAFEVSTGDLSRLVRAIINATL